MIQIVKHQGYIPSTPLNLKRLEKLLVPIQGSLDFGDVAAPLKGSGAHKVSTPYKSVERFAPGCFDKEAQEGPDCTSHAARNGGDIPRAVEIDVKGEPEEWITRGATEHLYGARGHSGKGMQPALAAGFLHKYGHLLRLKYKFADLSKYVYRVGAGWGGRNGPPQAVRDEAAKHPFRYQARIRSVEEARDALANGYGVFCGSQYGTDGKRDKRGVWKFNDSFNHSMVWGAADDGVILTDDLYFLVVNSWGPWASGGMPDWGPIPKGAGLIPSRDAKWMIETGECWAIGDFDGFPARDLPDYGSRTFLG